jgi:hypothetical protein
MLSPRSRGKGSRRVSWRDGGRGKQRKGTDWRKRAVHAVDELPKELGDSIELTLSVPYGRTEAETIYLFDQCVARISIRYQAELCGSGYYMHFLIRVPTAFASAMNAIIAQIKEP